MYAGRDFSPAEQDESIPYGLDFVDQLAPGETLTAAVWTLIVREGEDPDPNSHIIGAPTLETPDGTTLQTATRQRIAGVRPAAVLAVHECSPRLFHGSGNPATDQRAR